MAFEPKRVGKQKVRYDDDNDENPLVCQLLVDGQKVTPTSATVTVYSPTSSTAIVGPVAATKTGSLLTYSVDTTTEADYPIGTGYRAEFAVTYSSKVYPRIVIFDVVRWVLDLTIGFDQLVAFDDSIRGMQHDGDSDFNTLIMACRDYLQRRIERHVIGSRHLVENMILDPADLSVAFVFQCLYRIMLEKGRREEAGAYRQDFETELDGALKTIRYDEDQDEVQSDALADIIETRLYT